MFKLIYKKNNKNFLVYFHNYKTEKKISEILDYNFITKGGNLTKLNLTPKKSYLDWM